MKRGDRPTEAQVDGLLNKMRSFDVAIKQIHVKAVDLVDRCESCPWNP